MAGTIEYQVAFKMRSTTGEAESDRPTAVSGGDEVDKCQCGQEEASAER